MLKTTSSKNADTDNEVVPIEQNLSLLKRVKRMTGLDIKDWCDHMGFSRPCVYQSAEGMGARRVRVMLALFAGKPPSQVWPERSERVRKMDDAAYFEFHKEVQI